MQWSLDEERKGRLPCLQGSSPQTSRYLQTEIRRDYICLSVSYAFGLLMLVSSDTFKTRLIPHAGMCEKKLEAYHPNAKRNLLAQPTVVMPYKNSSQIVIGDRSSYYSRQFVSTNANCF